MRRGLRIVLAFVVIAFVFHWIWETAHGPAYVETAMPLERRIWHCLPMALVDTVWSGGVVAVGLLLARARPWRIAAVAGAVSAVVVEHFALDTGRWTYNEMMPLVPVVNVGLWPVVQMAVIPPVALLLTVNARARSGSRTRAFTSRDVALDQKRGVEDGNGNEQPRPTL